jgi:ABC-type transport system involved in multi-copper enzyme maturation permease subunit
MRSAARRWQTYAARSGFVAVLLIALTVVWGFNTSRLHHPGVADMALLGEYFFYGLVGTQLAVLMLAAPAATAGSICSDKACGILTHLFVTDLSNAEIVLGKLAARLLPVFGLLLAGLPVLALATLLGGIDPESVFGAFLISAGVAILGSAVALVASVWADKAHEVLLVTYGLAAAALLAVPIWELVQSITSGVGAPPPWLLKANPFWLAFAPYAEPLASTRDDPLWFLAGTLAIAAVLALLAVVAVRRVAIRREGAPTLSRRKRRLPSIWRSVRGPSLDANPVLWREWHRRQPSRWSRGVWTLFALGASAATALTTYQMLIDRPRGDTAGVVNGLVVEIGLLLFSASAVTSLSEERARGSLDVLLATPLTTREIVWGKWWGTFRTVPLLAALPAINLAIALLYDEPGWTNAYFDARAGFVLERWLLAVLVTALILAYGAALTSLGLALATRIARPGRAAAWCVTAYVFVTVVPVLVGALLLHQGGGEEMAYFAVACPFWGVGATSAMVQMSEFPSRETFVVSGLMWISIYFVAAGVLLRRTIATFDRRLGRAWQGIHGPRTTHSGTDTGGG